jgi:hypothetical protein
MSTRTDSLTRRLSQVERTVAEHAEQERLTACNCRIPPRGVTVLYKNDLENVEKEFSQTCPAHGFRRLGHIILFHSDYPYKYGRADELLDQYNARLEAWEAENDEF